MRDFKEGVGRVVFDYLTLYLEKGGSTVNLLKWGGSAVGRLGAVVK